MWDWMMGPSEEYKGQVSPSTNPFMAMYSLQAMGMQEHGPT